MNTRPGATDTPRVTVILATYNRARLLAQALDSLLGQTRAPDTILVVNDGSTDDTAALLERYGQRLQTIHTPNRGKACALNTGLETIGHGYVWIFDDDDIALPHALEAHLAFLAVHPEYDFSYSPKYTFSGRYDPAALAAQPRPRLAHVAPEAFFVHTMESMHTMMQGMLVPRRCYERVGGFDANLLRCQDQDMVLRLARRFRGGGLDEPTFALREHAGARGPASESHAEAERARVFERYRQRIFTRLKNDLPLAAYLPGQPDDAVLTPEQTQRALLQRACVMARNSLYTFAIHDLAAWSKAARKSPGAMTAAESFILSRITHIADPDIAPPGQYLRKLGQVLAWNHHNIKALARGFFWSARRELIRRRLKSTFTIFMSAALVSWGVTSAAWNGRLDKVDSTERSDV